MQWNLLLLILTGQCFFGMCQLYQYKFIQEKKNWTEARRHCRHNYTDLATVYDRTDMTDMTDMTRMTRMTRMTDMQQLSGVDAWIGLNCRGHGNTWKWSDNSSSEFRPNNFNPGSDGKCVSTKSGQWHSESCGVDKSFFCYKDKMTLIKQEKTWEEALDYCREKHHDLVSITNQKQEKWIQEEVEDAGTEFIWLGLRYTCTLDIWFWVNGEVLNLDNWNSTQSPTQTCNFAAAMQKVDPYKWVKKPDDQKFSFICV